MKWLTENWGSITLILYILINAANGVTKHWSHHKGVAKVAQYVAELLSVVSSINRPGVFKAPGKVGK